MNGIEITPELLEELKEKAKAASSSQDGRSVILWWSEPEIKYSAAANPAVVLALVAEIERLRAEKEIQCPRCGQILVIEEQK